MQEFERIQTYFREKGYDIWNAVEIAIFALPN